MLMFVALDWFWRLRAPLWRCPAFVLPALFGLGCAGALAREAGSEAALEPPPESAMRSSVLYLEPAVPVTRQLDFVLPPPKLPEDPELDPDFERRMRSISRFNEAIADAETVSGAWDNSLVEQLTTLGSLQQQQGNYPGAIETHERAIHVQRIHGGLHTIDQAPLVRRMIESHVAMRDWTEADTYHNYLFFIQQKTYGSSDPRLIPALGELANWHIHAFDIGHGQSLAMRLSSAQMLFATASRLVDMHFGADDSRYVEYQRGLARSAWLVAQNQDLLRELDRAQFRAPQEALRDTIMIDISLPVRPVGFRAGENALKNMMEHYRQQENGEQLAEATAQLADWYLLFNRRGQARETYRQAWDGLAGGEGAAEARRRLFGQVRQIPVYGTDGNGWMLNNFGFAPDSGETKYDYIDVSFDVTQWGEVRNIETLSEQSPDTESQHGWVRRNIRDSMFRPMLAGGEIVRSDDNAFRYRYWY